MSRLVPLLLAIALLPAVKAAAFEFSGRLSVLGSLARAGPGELGYVDGADERLSADQQSARLMLDGVAQDSEWSLHLKMSRVHRHGYPRESAPPSPFRYQKLAETWGDESGATDIGHEFDRAFYERRFENTTLALGRQPVDWGSGRFWQPLNVFGAFAPTDLDTDYKPGIDAAVLTWYPGAFSSLTGVYVPRTTELRDMRESGAVHYRGQVGELSELSLLGGSVLGNRVFGGAFESAWGGMGWRLEGVQYRVRTTQERFRYWIAGIDYQFDNGTSFAAEWYQNGHGADSESELAQMAPDLPAEFGLQQQLGKRLLGLNLERDITPLLHGGYTLLAASLHDAGGHSASSLLHQFTLIYSLGNEADLLVSLLTTSGKGLGDSGEIRSEFGHLPTTLTLRLRYYF